MEQLRKLEQVQRVLTFMESTNLITVSHNHYSNRFLADLLLLMVEPYGDMGMDQKCDLVCGFMPKVSASVLEEASSFINGAIQSEFGPTDCERNEIENHLLPWCGDQVCSTLPLNVENVAMIGLDAMQRANSTLEDFVRPSNIQFYRSYFMFHDMDVNDLHLLFKFLPVLSFTESYIYQLDTLNEKMLDIPTNGGAVPEEGFDKGENGSTNIKFFTEPFAPLVRHLECHGILTTRIKEELHCGEEYWALERKLCLAMKSEREVSVEDVTRAIHLKSFDYRILNLLMYQLRKEKVNDLHMEFLSISEFLVEVSDDLFDYEDDVAENNFNILRMFVRIYGPSTAPSMLAKYIAEAEQKYDRVLKTLDPLLASKYQRRCEEATKEGGKLSGHPLGTWSIPPLIIDEELYRRRSNADK
ncbi:hypothetical protein ACFE04_021240 [Oxalis oulophora]